MLFTLSLNIVIFLIIIKIIHNINVLYFDVILLHTEITYFIILLFHKFRIGINGYIINGTQKKMIFFLCKAPN